MTYETLLKAKARYEGKTDENSKKQLEKVLRNLQLYSGKEKNKKKED